MAYFNEGFIKNWLKKQVDDTKKWREEHSTPVKQEKPDKKKVQKPEIDLEILDKAADILKSVFGSSTLLKPHMVYRKKNTQNFDDDANLIGYITIMDPDNTEDDENVLLPNDDGSDDNWAARAEKVNKEIEKCEDKLDSAIKKKLEGYEVRYKTAYYKHWYYLEKA